MPAWPSHLVAAGVLVWDPDARLLLVKTHDRMSLVLPGGIVEADESPAAAGRREVLEEVGLGVTIGALLAVQHLAASQERPSSLQLVFDSEPLPALPPLVLQAAEIESAHWLAPDDAVAAHGPPGRVRLEAALTARIHGSVAYLDSSRPE